MGARGVPEDRDRVALTDEAVGMDHVVGEAIKVASPGINVRVVAHDRLFVKYAKRVVDRHQTTQARDVAAVDAVDEANRNGYTRTGSHTAGL